MLKPPVCPKCKEDLDVVVSLGETRWVFEDHHYDARYYNDHTIFKCPHCSQKLNHLFPEGIHPHQEA